MTMIEKMKDLVKRKGTCVLATVSDNDPHCSLMAYVTDNDCREIYMVTSRKTTKFRNLSANPSVSLLIDTREEHAGTQRPNVQALTVAGVYQEIEDETKKIRIRDQLRETHPHIKELLDMQDAEILCVKVTSFLLLDGVSDAHFEAF
jgi:nitroimidazol reductase NimA-like FMN-containing flavoprotein (pyridoxamine 5'-phosphate oxidase superfamily)